MLVLFDNGTPRTLARYLIDHHAVTEARARGWAELENGELLDVAEAAGFEVLVTTDKTLSYQQNLAARKIAIVAPRGFYRLRVPVSPTPPYCTAIVTVFNPAVPPTLIVTGTAAPGVTLAGTSALICITPATSPGAAP